MKKLILTGLLAITELFTSITMAQTAGTMSFTFTTPKHTSGNYVADGRYVLAVWIESCTTCGAGTTVGTSSFVRTKLRYCSGSATSYGNGTNDHLPTWACKSGGSCTSPNAMASTCNITNATTGATSTVFTARTVTWDGTNAAGTTLLADGNYRICIQETWGHTTSTATRYFPFVKGATAYTNTTDVANDTNFTGISLTWTPTLATQAFETKPNFSVYPNPSQGTFNLDLTTDITAIEVVDILGKIVYQEKIDAGKVSTSKELNLSHLNNGVYIINVYNDKAVATQKVIIEK